MGRKCKYGKRHEYLIVRRSCNKGECTELPFVEVTRDVLDELKKYRQLEGVEQPGVLMGSVIGNNRYRINRVSPPMPRDESTRCGCTRDAAMANKYILEQYEASEHTRVYFGEWHTHPEEYPIPSIVDVNSVLSISQLSSSLHFVILCIVGFEGICWGCVINGKWSPLMIYER